MYRKQRFLTGFTLVELLVVVIVLGILAAIGIPQYTRSVERGKMREAEANLHTMYMAEKMYKLNNPTVGYISCTDLDDCNSELEVEMNQKYFTYEVTDVTGGPPATTFTAKADRVGGRYPDCIMAISSREFSFNADCSFDYSGTTVQPGNIGKCKCP